MKGICIAIALLAAGILPAQEQSQSSTYTYDVNGHPVKGISTSATRAAGRKTMTQRMQSINGRSVPLESVEEKVISQGPNGRVIERIIRRYDQNGNPTPPEKIRIEESASGGKKVVKKTVYRADINGRFAVAEKSTTVATQQGNVIRANTSVERPTLNGSMDVVEKQVVVTTKQNNGSRSDVTIYRRNGGDRFRPAVQEVKETVKQGNKEIVTTTRYNTINATGQMEFANQTVRNTEKLPDGSEKTVIDVYNANVPGISATDTSGKPQLKEQRIIERRKARDGSIVETTGVRLASISDPGRLGSYRKISEVTCTGNCKASNSDNTTAPAGSDNSGSGKSDSGNTTK